MESYTGGSIKKANTTYACPSAESQNDLKNSVKNLHYGVNSYSTFTFYEKTPGTPGVRGNQADPKKRLAGPDWVYWNRHGSTKLDHIRDASRFIYFMDHGMNLFSEWNFDPLRSPESMAYSTRWHYYYEGSGVYGISNVVHYDGSAGQEPDDFNTDWLFYMYKDR